MLRCVYNTTFDCCLTGKLIASNYAIYHLRSVCGVISLPPFPTLNAQALVVCSRQMSDGRKIDARHQPASQNAKHRTIRVCSTQNETAGEPNDRVLPTAVRTRSCPSHQSRVDKILSALKSTTEIQLIIFFPYSLNF